MKSSLTTAPEKRILQTQGEPEVSSQQQPKSLSGPITVGSAVHPLSSLHSGESWEVAALTPESKWNFYPRFLRLGAINSFSNLMVPLASLVDMAFLGHLEDLNYLAGVAIATVLFDYLYRMSRFLRMGTTGPTAQAAGRDDTTDIVLILLRNGVIALVMAGLFLSLQIPIREFGFALLNAAPDVKSAGVDYFNTRIWGAPAVLLNFVLLGWWVGREHGDKVLALSLVGCGSNILLDYWLVFHLGWASAGVGLATTISQYLMVGLGLMFVGLEGWFSKVPAVVHQIWHPQELRRTFQLNADIWIRSCVNVSTSALFIGLSASLGTLTLAVNTLLLHAVGLISHLIVGLSFATESLAGHFQGAGDRPKLMPLLQLSLGISLGIGGFAALLLNLFPSSLFGLLTNHGSVINQLGDYLLWLFPVLLFGALAFMLNGYFLGLTKSAIVRNSILISALVGFGPIAGLAWWLKSEHLLWLAMAVFMLLRAMTQLNHVTGTVDSNDPTMTISSDNWHAQQSGTLAISINPHDHVSVCANKKVA